MNTKIDDIVFVIGCGYNETEKQFWDIINNNYIGVGLDSKFPYKGDWNDDMFWNDIISSSFKYNELVSHVFLDRCVINTMNSNIFEKMLIFIIFILKPNGKFYITKEAWDYITKGYISFLLDLHSNLRPINTNGYQEEDRKKLELIINNGNFFMLENEYKYPLTQSHDHEFLSLGRNSWIVFQKLKRN